MEFAEEGLLIFCYSDKLFYGPLENPFMSCVSGGFFDTDCLDGDWGFFLIFVDGRWLV